jgi:hypothetical protein
VTIVLAGEIFAGGRGGGARGRWWQGKPALLGSRGRENVVLTLFKSMGRPKLLQLGFIYKWARCHKCQQGKGKGKGKEVKRIIKMLTQKRITFFSSRTASWHGKGWEAQTRMKSL